MCNLRIFVSEIGGLSGSIVTRWGRGTEEEENLRENRRDTRDDEEKGQDQFSKGQMTVMVTSVASAGLAVPKHGARHVSRFASLYFRSSSSVSWWGQKKLTKKVRF